MDVLRTLELDSRSAVSRKAISKVHMCTQNNQLNKVYNLQIRKNLNQAISFSESRQGSLAPSSRADDDNIGDHLSEMYCLKLLNG